MTFSIEFEDELNEEPVLHHYIYSLERNNCIVFEFTTPTAVLVYAVHPLECETYLRQCGVSNSPRAGTRKRDPFRRWERQ